jgi:chromosome segregation ATPase
MIKKYIWIGVFALALTACQNDNNGVDSTAENGADNTIINDLKEENGALKTELAQKDSTITNYIGYINEIRANLDLIKDKQRFIISKKTNSEALQADDASLIEEIKLLGQLMADNKSKIFTLKSNVKDANLKMDGLDEMIMSLTEDVDEKNMEIFQLQQELENVDAAFSELFEAYTDKATMLNEANIKLNTAYYTIGTKAELLENEVITKEGGILGVGASKELKNDFNRSYFTEVAIDAVAEIPLGSKKVELVTTHPSSSYELVGEDPVEKIIIKNSEEFWSVSKYLVVLVK